MRLRKSRSRLARTVSRSSTYSRIDSSGSIEIDQRFSAISTSWKPTSVWEKIREACSWEETSQTIVRLPSAAARSPSATATVVLPTPPLPVTKTSRLSRMSGIGVIPSVLSHDIGREMTRSSRCQTRTQGARIVVLSGRLRTQYGGDLGLSFPVGSYETGHQISGGGRKNGYPCEYPRNGIS